VLTTVYALQMVRPLESLGTAARDLARALGYLRPLLDLLSEPLSDDSPNTAHAGAAPAARQQRATAVRLENLHFGYDPQRPVIRGIDLDVPAGSTTAIVGRSGSGKSSLARLLMRLYSPQQGRILLDGRTIDSIGVAELRRTLVGLVPQETTLLHDSIAGNIALGSPHASREEIRAAAHGAQLDELLAGLPHGLDTPVGERGMQLSGGERQRVGIARALLRRPGLYVLDEPTSMLDSRTELAIQEALRALSADATVIVIAHRLSTIVDADEIVVLDEGRIHERGSHRALLARNGLYARMWRQQMTGAP
jgi:ATP-binding cassette subfamily B protein